MRDVAPRRIILVSLAIPLIVSVLLAISWSMRWPLVGDASLMQYVVFSMSKGMTHYKDIVDVNLPGAYFFEAFAMRLFGWGALAWRLYVLALLLIIAIAMSSIAGSKRKFAGLLAAAMFLLIHIQDGIAQLGQRYLLVAALLLSGYALLFLAQRQPRGGLTIFLWNFLIGLSITVKLLLLPLGILLLLVSAKRSHRLWLGPARHFACGVAGLSLPSGCAVLWLWHRGALLAFQAIATTLVPFHASLGRRPVSYLLAHCMSPLAVVCAAWVLVATILRPEMSLKRLEIVLVWRPRFSLMSPKVRVTHTTGIHWCACC